MGFPYLHIKWKSKLRSSSSSNSVHPSSDGHDQHLHSRSRNKVFERLGPVSQQQYLEINELLKKTPPDSPFGDEDLDEDDCSGDDEDEDDVPGLVSDQEIASPHTKPDHLQNPAMMLPTSFPQVRFIGITDTGSRRCESDISLRDLPSLLQSRSSADGVKQRHAFSTSARAAEVKVRRMNKRERLQGVADMLIMGNKYGGWYCEQSRENHSANEGGKVFPLPLPRYQLPLPGISMLNNLKSTPHPLPQPPFYPKLHIHCDSKLPQKTQIPDRLQSVSIDILKKQMQKTMQSDPPYSNSQHRSSLPLPAPNRSVSPTAQRFTLPSLPGSSCPSPLNPSSMSPHSPRPLFRKVPKKWQKGKVLGQGSFGTVYEGLNLEDGSFFAVKVSSDKDTSPEIRQEVDVLSKLEHPNIVSYYGSSIEEGRLCIFLELVRMGSLDANLKKYKFTDETIRTYTRQILLGLDYLHTKNTIHRDIKCSNILVDVNGQVKLSDFGIAKKIEDTLIYSVKGTPLYMAPEVITANKSSYSFPADIWSLGCTVLEMAEGKPPWSHLNGFAFMFKVNNGELPPMPKGLGPDVKDFICSCLKYDPKERPTAAELLQHPFVANAPEPFPACIPPQSPLHYGQSESSKTTCNNGNHHLPTLGHSNEAFQRAQTLL